ncbi:tripartite tricarboxylate transporter TctB family protein [Celeribacter indicus]|uniref:DUF1468 domain-containing protein n=1 Tax=Celeribacter indicus TaxID=1208324 RepID=A0A0B5DUM5_9RHOB|nr:tripartite tricarboxylate transporter TctB family protein [Celeribacter indicus]AJE46724.1 hypothetical protein P73_2009 [Celeribacter indicus]SDX04872.1 Tripartite tricarboxylate transporter TctB family protein [Celeribacter indicus]
MHNRDYRDIAGGALILVVGLIAAYMAFSGMKIGDLRRIGPGMFPAITGILLALLGIAILVPALSRSGARVRVQLRPILAVSAAIVLFCLTIETMGIVPAVVLLTVVSALADSRSRPLTTALNAAALALIATVIFKFGFSLSVPILSLPW